jgi:hypothetical protein
MSIKAFAICDDMGVHYAEGQLLVFAKRVDAERVRKDINIEQDGEYKGRVEAVFIERKATK